MIFGVNLLTLDVLVLFISMNDGIQTCYRMNEQELDMQALSYGLRVLPEKAKHVFLSNKNVIQCLYQCERMKRFVTC